MKTLYTAKVHTVGGRDGHAKSDDGKIDLKLGRPGSNDAGTNPEQLFAAGYSACFGGALAHIAKLEKIQVNAVTVDAEVNLNQSDDGFSLSAALHVTVDGVDDATAKSLAEKAHAFCPYSKATRGNIEVKLTAEGTGEQAAA
ncbi:MAG: hypothetical protein DI582_09705 [Azospirillum brasilense]|nr:MAG: hypothetical protein DI582_09705 [Azospirillum brasilense]